MSNSYLQAVYKGKTEWWRYLGGISIILFFWFIIGSLLTAIILLVYGFVFAPDSVGIELLELTGAFPRLEFIAINVSFIPMLIGVLFAVRFIHKRPIGSLFSAAQRIRWPRLMAGFGLYFVLVMAASLIEYLINPEIYVWTFEWQRWWPFALMILVLTPIQTTAEELLFRGYILQMSGHWAKSIWVLGIINGVLFMMPHLANPEVRVDPILLPLGYFASGFFFAFITLRDESLDLTLGTHAANNMYALMFSNYIDSALPTPAMFTVMELDPVFSLISFVVIAVLFSMVMLRPTVRSDEMVDAR